MTIRPFHPRLDDLPRVLPIFPLSGALLLPDGKLPLNIFEPRYLALVQDSLAWGRIIGMVQPVKATEDGSAEPVFDTGCAGRISSFSETEDGRLLITLTGICRFRIVEELESARGYRRVIANWEIFRQDLEPALEVAIDRPRLMAALKKFVKLHNLDINWKAIESASDLALTVSLAMACPFEPPEKQALLESVDAAQRAATLITLMEMAVAGQKGAGRTLRQ